jgi:peptidoglycan pentaglycine glycine transferase (the first glycine)
MVSQSVTEWDEFIHLHPEAHILQTSSWGELKSHFGWNAEKIRVGQCGAQVLFRKLPLGFSYAYIPKGPVGDNWRGLWPEVDKVCRSHRAIVLSVEPDCWEPVPQEIEGCFLNFRFTNRSIQPRRTIIVDLVGGEEQWLENMKQKTRYNIRLAEKKGVVVRSSSDVASFSRLMNITGTRDSFGVHNQAYYQIAYDCFHPSGKCNLLFAEYNEKLLAGLMVFASGYRAWYFYGASSDEERNRMPTYLLQWEAIRWAAEAGCTSYDLWGIPDYDEEDLESQFTQRADGLWGVYRFKRGFGGKMVRSGGAWEKVYLPGLYKLFKVITGRREI